MVEVEALLPDGTPAANPRVLALLEKVEQMFASIKPEKLPPNWDNLVGDTDPHSPTFGYTNKQLMEFNCPLNH